MTADTFFIYVVTPLLIMITGLFIFLVKRTFRYLRTTSALDGTRMARRRAKYGIK